MTTSPALMIFAVAALAALIGVEARAQRIVVLAKPAATLALIGVVGLPAEGWLPALVAVGLGLSCAGDVALLWNTQKAFLAGLSLFLVAHIVYTAAFIADGARPPGLLGLLGAALVVTAAGLLVRSVWAGVREALRPPVVVYAIAISAMMIAAICRVSSTPEWTAKVGLVGAGLFFLSDAILARNRFGRPLPHGQTLTLVLYWSGQLGIALSAR